MILIFLQNRQKPRGRLYSLYKEDPMHPLPVSASQVVNKESHPLVQMQVSSAIAVTKSVQEHASTGDELRSISPTIGKPALPPKPPPPLVKTSTPPPPPRQNAYQLPHLQYHQPDTSSEEGSGQTAYYTDKPTQQKDMITPPRIPNGNGGSTLTAKSNVGGNSIDSSESDNSSSSTSMRSVFNKKK